MHRYKFIVEIGLPCPKCGLLNADVIYEILNTAWAGIPTTDIKVTEEKHPCAAITAAEGRE